MSLRWMGRVWVCLLCAACTPKNEVAPPCDTPECRQAEIVEAWEASPDQAVALLEKLPSEVERLAAMSQLISRFPSEVGPLRKG